MRNRIATLVVSLLVLTGCGSGISQEDLDQAVADAVEAATATTTPRATTTTAAPMVTTSSNPTTTMSQNIHQTATEGNITYDIGVLAEGTCTQIVREVENVGSRAANIGMMFLQLMKLDPESLSTFEEWREDSLGPAWNIVSSVAKDENIPLHVATYASNVSSALGSWYVASTLLADSYNEQQVLLWFEGATPVSDALKAYPTCND